MTKVTQTSWLGGQMDVRMTGRQDMANYRNGASVLKNFVPVKLGSIRKRPGTDFVADLTEWVGANAFRMIPFGYRTGDCFVLVVCPNGTGGKARAYRPDGTFATVTGDIPYGDEDLGGIGYVQCNDVAFLAHLDYPPAEILHDLDDNGADTFAYRKIEFNPVKVKPTIGTISMTRQFFEDFTFDSDTQNKLDNYKSRADFLDPENKWATAYNNLYNDESKRIYSGKTTVNYRASVVVDGKEGPLSDVGSISFTSPWTESQVVKIPVSVDAPEDYRKMKVRLYKENGGVYGVIGESQDVSEKYEFVIDKNYAAPAGVVSKWFRYRIVMDGVEETRYREPESQAKVTTDEGTKIHVVIKETIDAEDAAAFAVRVYARNQSTYVEETPPPGRMYLFTDDNIAPDTTETPIDDSDGTPFSGAGDYPGSVGLYQQRLVWAGTWNDPARIWMSRAGDFYEYRPHVRLQTDDAIDFILPITQFANLNFIVELGRLFAFSECAELVIGSASANQGVSYETIMATEHSHLGCTKRLPPIIANNTLLFVNRTGDSVRDYDEELGSTRFGGKDVSVFSTSIFRDNPIVDWTWQQEPNSTVWCVLADGRLASFTYDKEQKIGAWAVHELGGGGKAVGIAKTCAVFGRDAAHPTTGEIMVAVERGEGEARRVTLERMRPWGAKNDELVENILCMDCVRETLQHEIDDDGFSAWASDPGRIPLDEYRLQDGRMAILFYRSEDDSEWIVYVGYTFESVMTTMPPVIGDQGGASQFDVKLGQHAHVRTVGSQGGEIYAVGMRSQASKIDEGAVRDGEDGAAFRDVDVILAGSNNRDGRVTVRHDGPWPFQLSLLELDYEVES